MKYPFSLIELLFPFSVLLMLFDFLKIHPYINISVYRVSQIAILYLIIIFLLSKRNIKFNLYNPTFLLLIGFIALSLIICPFSTNVNISLFEIFRLFQFITLALIMFLFLKIVWRTEYWIHLSNIILFGAVIAGLSIITDSLGATRFYMWYADRAYRLSELRSCGILGEPNFAAGKLAMFLPFAFFSYRYYASQHKMTESLLIFITWFVILLAIFLTGSRMGGIVTVLSLSLFLIKEMKLLLSFKAIFIVILVGLIIIFVIPITGFCFSNFHDQSHFIINQYLRLLSFLGIWDSTLLDLSLRYRPTLIIVGLEMFIDNPVTGVGLGNYASNIIKYGLYGYAYSHNTFLSILAETGFFGFAAFLALFIQIGRNIYWNYRTSNSSDFFFYFGLSFFNLIIMLFFLHDFGNKYFWGMFVVLSMLFDHKKASLRTEGPRLNGKYPNQFWPALSM